MVSVLEADYYVYVCGEVVVRIVKAKKAFTPANISGVDCYVVQEIPDDDIPYNYNFYYTREYCFSKMETPLLDMKLESLKRVTKKIELYEKFNDATTHLKSTMFRNSAHDDIYNRILMNEINEYDKSKYIGSLLAAEFECSRIQTIEAFVESIKLKYQDASEMFAYIRYKTYDFAKLVGDKRYDEAEEIIKEIHQKLKLPY